MILPAHFAKLAAHGKATIALVPVREPHWATRKNGTIYKAIPWEPRVGNREPLQMPVKPNRDYCQPCLRKDGVDIPLEPSPTRRRRTRSDQPAWLWCWRCGHHESPSTRVQTIAEIVILTGDTIRLGDLLNDTPDMLKLVRATGHKTRAEYANHWLRAMTKTWPPQTTGHCPRCEATGVLDPEGVIEGLADLEVCPDCDLGEIMVDAPTTDEQVIARFKRHARRLMHVVTFELDTTAHLRLLSPAGKPRGDDHGYTDNPSDAMSGSADPGEAVPTRWQEKFTADANDANELLRLARGEGRDLRNQRRYQQRKAAA